MEQTSREVVLEIDVDQGRLSPLDLRRVTLLEFSTGKLVPEGASGIRPKLRGTIIESREPTEIADGRWRLRLRVRTDMDPSELRSLNLIEFAQDGPQTICRTVRDPESMRLADVFAAVLLGVRVSTTSTLASPP